MAEPLRCPNCGADIAGALAEQVRREEAAKAEGRQRALAAREAALGQREREQDEAVKRQVEEQGRLTVQRVRKEEAARVAVEREAEQRELLAAQKERDEAKQVELALRHERAAVVQKEKDLDLLLLRRLDEERARLAAEAVRGADEAHALRMREAQAQMAGMQRTIEELKRKAEQGSQQLQGEVQETSLEDLLKREFPGDVVEPVPKGVRGADVVQRVRGAGGAVSGVILWESKRTKAWVDAWLPKLRDDQRELKADLAALVSQVLPKEAHAGAPIEGVWVCTYAGALGLAHALRRVLIDVAAERRAQEGRGDKTAMLYGYLTGPEFRSRIEGLLEPFRALQEDLDKERAAMERLWAKRAQQIQRALRSISGMRGDIEGIAQGALPGLPSLDLPGLEPGSPASA